MERANHAALYSSEDQGRHHEPGLGLSVAAGCTAWPAKRSSWLALPARQAEAKAMKPLCRGYDPAFNAALLQNCATDGPLPDTRLRLAFCIERADFRVHPMPRDCAPRRQQQEEAQRARRAALMAAEAGALGSWGLAPVPGFSSCPVGAALRLPPVAHHDKAG